MDLTKGSLRKQMIAFAVPLILTSVFKQSFSFVDTLIVARFCNPDSLSAISLASSLYSILASFANGFGIGCAVVIGKTYGTKRENETKSTAYTLLMLGTGLSSILALSCVLLASSFVKWIHTPPEIVDLTCRVLRFYSIDLLFYGISLAASCLLNGMGDSKNPFRISTFSGLLNLILDLIAVTVFRADVIGCVIATLVSQVTSAICMTVCVVQKMLRVSARIVFRRSSIKEVFAIGSTIIAQESMFNLLAILAQAVVAPYGVDYINGYSIGRQIFSIFSTAVNGYSRAYSTALSHNYGAGRFDRIREAGKASRIDGNILCLALAALSLLICRPLNRFILADASKQAVTYSMAYVTLSIPMYFISMHTQRTSAALRVYKMNRKIFISSIITMIVKAACLCAVASVSIYLLPLTDIIGKTAALLYLKSGEKHALTGSEQPF